MKDTLYGEMNITEVRTIVRCVYADLSDLLIKNDAFADCSSFKRSVDALEKIHCAKWHLRTF